jgi:uncharacterized membrane protein YfcA
MQELLTLTQTEFTLLAVICFCAGLIRGFTGFALSAIVMASAALILSPLALIPICWWLETVASAMMVRGGWKDADQGAAVTLWLGSAVTVPIGLYFTQNVSAELSQTVALCLILVLAVTQLANMRLAFLNTRAGLVSAGIGAGIATGLASVGGMVVALYVLSSDRNPRQMRAALVMFLFLGTITTFVTLLLFGVLDKIAMLCAATLTIPTSLGVFAGKRLFTPNFEPYYRPICLSLLVGLSMVGLIRLAT